MDIWTWRKHKKTRTWQVDFWNWNRPSLGPWGLGATRSWPEQPCQPIGRRKEWKMDMSETKTETRLPENPQYGSFSKQKTMNLVVLNVSVSWYPPFSEKPRSDCPWCQVIVEIGAGCGLVGRPNWKDLEKETFVTITSHVGIHATYISVSF